MKVVLFCGGLGLRMRTHVDSAPKPMMTIGDRPVLWHIMRYFAHFGHTEFILCLGYGAHHDATRRWGRCRIRSALNGPAARHALRS